MAKKAAISKKGKKAGDGKAAQAYEHKKEKLLLRPDVGLQPQFKPKKPPKTYRYDPSLDPTLSWDINADRGRASGLSANKIDQSILARASRGELVPQDPNDESASALLDRIRADRPKDHAIRRWPVSRKKARSNT